MGYVRDMGSTELFQYSEERSRRRRAARARRQRIRRIGVPLAMIVTASGTAGTAFAGAAKASGSHRRAAARTLNHRILKVNTTGPDVARLQRLLGVPVDGMFGRGTLRAVKRFQHEHGLLVDGQVGPKTRDAIAAEDRGTPGEQVVQYGSRGAMVVDLQKRLGIPADGDFGPITRAAVEAFQASHGLVVDGQAGAHTRATLHRVGSWHVPAADLPRGHSHHHQHIHHPKHQNGGVTRAERAVHVAERYLGVRYVWGGESPTGFDCSGLVQFAYNAIGISIPRTTYEQYRIGEPVSRDELEPGDLLFFDHVGHVGMYVGGGRFIHAPHTGTVVQFGTLSGWYAEHFVGARRVTR